jgi:signal transduction histidine kinase
MLGLGVALSAAFALWPLEYDRIGLVAPHPLDLPGRAVVEPILAPVALASYPAFQLLWTAALVVRIHRAEGDEARQLRWLGLAVLMSLTVLIGGFLSTGSPVPGLLIIPLVPIAAGRAILKYRLYDIDPVISRTIVIGVMLLVIWGGYVAVVLGVGALVPAPSGILTLLTTAVVAVAFDPIRRRTQRLADRWVYGQRPTPYEALSQIAAQLREAPNDLLDGIAATTANSVGATQVVVWVGGAEHLVPTAAWPEALPIREPKTLATLAEGRELLRPVVHDGNVLGAITIAKPVGDPLTQAEDSLLADLATQTGLVIAHQSQGRELKAAARRIVAAEDAARRRIERDLHDGAQLRLVTLGLELAGLVEHARASSDPAFATRVDHARALLLEATAELRELGRGLHPMVLAEAGLGPALGALADRSTIPVRLQLHLDERPPAEVEATVYFLVSEALANAARHSGAQVARVEIGEDGDRLCVTVVDDGCGGARIGAGSGLQGLSDRLAAVGGRLDVESPSGGGTRIRGVLPCA